MNTEQLQAAVQNAIQTKTTTMFFVDRHGEIDQVTVTGRSAQEDEWPLHLIARISTPYFEICTVGPDGNGKIKLFEGVISRDISVNDLLEAEQAAQAERVRFYSERAEQYGDSAWPKGATAGF